MTAESGSGKLLAQLLGQLDAALTMLSAVDPDELDPLLLVDSVSRLVDVETRLAAMQARWLAAADRSDAIVGAVGRPASAWLCEELHLGGAEAGRRLRLARGLAERPALAAALDGARITTDQAAVILAAVRGLTPDAATAVETALIASAETATTAELARAVDEVRARVAGETAAAQAARHHERRGLRLDETPSGTGRLTGALSSECRESVKVALQAAGGGHSPDDNRTVAQRQHDALQEIAQFYLDHSQDAAPEAGERPRIVVTMPYDALRTAVLDGDGALRGPSGTALPGGVFDSGAPVTAAAVRRMACDAQILPAVVNGLSEVLDLGRSARSFSLAIKRAARLRDGGRCARHGCRRRIVDCHHIEWWSRGGATSLENAAWLCAFHHWLVHEGGWSLRRLGPGRYVFTDPNGREHGPPPQAGPPGRQVAA